MTNLKKRCGSCEHKWKYHSGDGCWFTVIMGRRDRNLVCACRVPWVPGEDE